MATAIQLQQSTIDALDEIVARGRFPSHDEAIRTALHIVEENDAFDDGPLSEAEIAGIEQGLADVAAGRVYPIEQVRVEMERRFACGA